MSGATENKILTLKRIKANQPCRSDEQEYDTNVLSSLHKDGYIKASVYTPIKTGIPKFLDMGITFDGELFLEEYKSNNRKKLNAFAHWLLNHILTVLLSVVVAGLITWLGWN